MCSKEHAKTYFQNETSWIFFKLAPHILLVNRSIPVKVPSGNSFQEQRKWRLKSGLRCTFGFLSLRWVALLTQFVYGARQHHGALGVEAPPVCVVAPGAVWGCSSHHTYNETTVIQCSDKNPKVLQSPDFGRHFLCSWSEIPLGTSTGMLLLTSRMCGASLKKIQRVSFWK